MAPPVRRYRAPRTVQGKHGQWYAEFDGLFACREFVVLPTGALVAPYGLGFSVASAPEAAPGIPDLVTVPLGAFETQWERHAQTWLHHHVIAQQAKPSGDLRSFRAAIPDDASEHGAGVWYCQFVDGIARRQFELYASGTLVAPYDIGLAEHFEWVVTDPHYQAASAAECERIWERAAVPRLREVARTPS